MKNIGTRLGVGYFGVKPPTHFFKGMLK